MARVRLTRSRDPARAAPDAAYETLRKLALPLRGEPLDFDPLMARIGSARFVLIGEASHGTHDFYRARAELTKRLIRERGFTAIAAEADWPDAHRVNRFVQNRDDDTTAAESLGDFKRFPRWMWRNADMLAFVGWLRAHNDAVRHPHRPVGFYGLDLYSLHASIEAVLDYLRVVDPAAAARARERYSCFDHVGADMHRYAHTTRVGLTPSCEREVVAQLVELQRSHADYARRYSHLDPDAHFHAEQNARVVQNAEEYYRTVMLGGAMSWNLRDTHMAETLGLLAAHLSHGGEQAKVVVWAHNSHVGDARRTELGRHGELNVGELVREEHPHDSVLIGFTTYSGTVTAANDWDAPAEQKRVRPALPGSFERLFHDAGLGNALLLFNDGEEMDRALGEPRTERAIGVIYRPATEAISHYFKANISRQFDALLHYDVTRAVEPLDRDALWDRGELPETFPSAL